MLTAFRGAWSFTAYDHAFSNDSGQAFEMEAGTVAGRGTTDSFDVEALIHASRGSNGNPDDFGLVLTSTLTAAETGTYRFDLTSDDGSTLRLTDSAGRAVSVLNGDGRRLTYLDNDHAQAATTRFGKVQLEAGETYTIEIRYWENGGGNTLDATVTRPSGKTEALATSAMLESPTSEATQATSGWSFTAYDHAFSNDSGQAFEMEAGTVAGRGTTDSFDVEALIHASRGSNGNPDDFGLVLTSTLTAAETGTYRFDLTSDDGSTLRLTDSAGRAVSVLNGDGRRLTYLDNDHAQAATTRFGKVQLEAGETYTIEIRYWENGGGNTLDATVTRPSGKTEALATSAMLESPTSEATQATSGWSFTAYDHAFSNDSGQAFEMEAGTVAGRGTTDSFDVEALIHASRGSNGNPDDFGLVLTSTLTAAETGTYRFDLTSDDGSTLRLTDSAGRAVSVLNGDGRRLTYLDNDHAQAATTRFGKVQLEAGETYTIEIRYWENGGGNTLDATVTRPSGKTEALATSAMLESPTSEATQATSGWSFTAYDHAFSNDSGQAFEMEAGTVAGRGTTDSFDVEALIHASRGSNGNPDDFGLVLTSTLTAAETGTYRFDLTSDDGSTLRLTDSAGRAVSVLNGDGRRLTYLDNDHAQAATTRFGKVQLEAGETYTIEIRYWENGGGNTLDATVTRPSGKTEALATSAMLESPTSEATQATSGWSFTAYDHAFSNDSGQAFEMEAGTVAGRGTTDSFDVEALIHASRGSNGNPDDFGLVLTSTLTAAETGTYRFDLTSDDGSTLRLTDSAGRAVSVLNGDGRRLTYLDNDHAQAATTRFGKVQLEAGETYTIEIRYWENGGGNTLDATVTRPSGKTEALATSTLLGTATSGDEPAEPDTGENPDSGDTGGQTPPETDSETETDNGSGEQTDTPTDTEAPASDPEPQPAPDILVQGTTANIAGGRVTTFELEDASEIVTVEITGLPAHGNATVNPDNTVALVLSGSDYSGPLSIDYTVILTDSTVEKRTATFEVAAPSQEAGWGTGEHYMLEEDANGDIIVETGDNHRKVYVSGSNDALSRADIAALEGLAASQITDAWLIRNPEYGSSEAMALDNETGLAVWQGLIGEDEAPGSHWLLFEAGYEYSGQVLDSGSDPGARGESELHPLHITSYGEGQRPDITYVGMFSPDPANGVHSGNIVVSDVEFRGAKVSNSNTLFHDVGISDRLMNIRNASKLTLHDSEVTHVLADEPEGDLWVYAKAQGLYAYGIDGLLIEGSLFHHNGWEDDYRMDGSTEGGMPPSMFSHNVYLQNNTTNVTFRDNIISQGASTGVQFRGGGYVEDNLFVDNNIAVNFMGGIYKDDGPIGNFTFFADNMITSAGYKKVDYSNGALNWGLRNEAYDSTLLDNIVAHLADPENLDEQIVKEHDGPALNHNYPAFYDDTIIYNWQGSDPTHDHSLARDKNTDGIDPAIADQTTIQNFAANVLGRNDATISDLMDHIESLAGTALDDTITAADIVAWFQNGFGVAPNGNGAATNHRFVPNDLADGLRWDNRINWTTEDVPDDGDNVDLGGNWVHYGARTTAIGDLDLGTGGRLHVTSGKLAVDGTLAAGERGGLVTVDGAGQFWIDGYADGGRLTIDVDGGRFANTGTVTGTTSLAVSDGQVILATDGAIYDLAAGSELRIEGSEAKVGFDGDAKDPAVLRMDDAAVLTFDGVADGFSTLEEFRSGRWDQQGSPVKSGVLLDGTLQIDLAGAGSDSYTLIAVDALRGVLDAISLHGLGTARDVEVVIDYEADELRLEFGDGSGQVDIDIIGQADDGADEAADLWAALDAGGAVDTGTPLLTVEDVPLPELIDIA